MGSRPCRRCHLFIVDPQTASTIVPSALLWRKVHFRAAVVLSFCPQAHFLCLRRIHPSIGIRSMVFFRILVESRDAGRKTTPHMTEVDTGTDSRAHSVFLAFILIAVLQSFFRREHLGHITSVREGIGNVPLHVGLLHITERIALEILVLMNEHTFFERCKVLERFGIFVPQHGTFTVVVLRATAQPSTFSQCQHARIEIVFQHHVFFSGQQTVVPQGHNRAYHIISLFGQIINLTVIQGHQVGKGIEVIGVMELAVDVRDARSYLTAEAPHLHHIDFTRLVVPTRIPGDNLLALRTDVRHHFRYECLVPESHLVGSDVEIRKIRKSFAHLVHQEFQNLHAFCALHVVTEGTHESGTVSRHIHFRNQQYIVLLTECHQVLGFFDGVILALQTSHVHAIVQHRENLAFQSPCLVFGEVPMEDIDFVSRQDGDFLLQFIHSQITTAHVVHESTDLECRPVHDFTCLVATFLLFQLAQGLHGPIHALFGSSFHLNALAGHHQAISFFLVQLRSFNLRNQLHYDFTGRLVHNGSASFCNEVGPCFLPNRRSQLDISHTEAATFCCNLLRFR